MSPESSIYIYFAFSMTLSAFWGDNLDGLTDCRNLSFYASLAFTACAFLSSFLKFSRRVPCLVILLFVCFCLNHAHLGDAFALWGYPAILTLCTFWGSHAYKRYLKEEELEKEFRKGLDEIIDRDFPHLKD